MCYVLFKMNTVHFEYSLTVLGLLFKTVGFKQLQTHILNKIIIQDIPVHPKIEQIKQFFCDNFN
jgi:hypothetical protein